MQPTLYWKNAFQQGLPFTFNPKVLYRGYIPSVVNNSAMIGSQFAIAGILQEKYLAFTGRKRNAGGLDSLFFSTFAAGYISGFWCGPIELAMIQQQRFGMSLGNCLKKIIGEFGISQGIFKGTFNTSMREGNGFFFVIVSSLLFGVFGAGAHLNTHDCFQF